MSKTKLFALGGMMEIGKTTIIVEHENEMAIIDAGIKFTNDIESGVEGIIPNYEYLHKNQNKIVGLFVTHGHEDHIGGIPYLLQKVKINKIYGSFLTIEYIKNKLKDFDSKIPIEYEEIKKESVFKFKYLTIDFWTSQHSIPDSFGIRVKTPNGSIFDTGDFRFDYSPTNKSYTDFEKLKQISQEKLSVLISDSTNSMSQGHSPSEKKIINNLEEIVKNAQGKVVFTTFASNVNRIKIAIYIAQKYGRKVVVFGRSMNNSINLIKRLNIIKFDDPQNIFINKKDVHSLDDKKILVLSTGSQGEELAALARMSVHKNNFIKIKKNDVIIFSSSPIPGNRMSIEQLINNLYKCGAIIKENNVDGLLHTSGHAYKNEHTKIFEILKPKYFVPYHGGYRQSAAHAQTAIESKIKNVLLVENGELLTLENNVLQKTDQKINCENIYIDGNVASNETLETIEKRKKLGENGFINIVALIDKEKKQIIGSTKIISRGTFYVNNLQDLINKIQKMSHGTILYIIKNINNWKISRIKNSLRNKIEPFLFREKRRKPEIVVSILFK